MAKSTQSKSGAAGESNTTRDHDFIQSWVEAREGLPAVVKTSKGESELLRIKFKGNEAANLKEISWEDFFRIFDESKLDFLYQEKTKDGSLSRFFKFVRK